MGLSGLAIYKLLPKTNCKECGYPTCLAFAMKLAARQVELSDCPHVSDEAKSTLDAASAPPVRLITVGGDGRKLEVGNETVLFRHEKTFYHQPGIFYRLSDADPATCAGKMAEIAQYQVERVGVELRADGVALEHEADNPAALAQCAQKAAEVGLAAILISNDPAALEEALKAAKGARPLIYAAAGDNWQAMADLAARYEAPLAVRAQDLSGLADLTEKIKGKGVEDLVLAPQTTGWADSLATFTQIRRLSIKKNYRPLGYPIMAMAGQVADGCTPSADTDEEALLAAQFVAKYASFVVLDTFDPATLYPLLTLRQNIYTDPQKPIQVSPGLYEIGEPKPESPLLVTTNFSLTYFSVAGEVEASGIPCWLLVADSEGMSVLTAWAAGKFDAERIAKSVGAMGVTDKVAHRKIVIPGHVSSISGELEEELPGWQILVGPREAIGIPSYLKNFA